MSELFNDMQGISALTENEHTNTPEDEVFRLAQTLTFNKINLLRLAHFINNELKDCDILQSGVDFCEDYRTTSFESEEIEEIWFDSNGMLKFLKWCEPIEKDLFN